MKRLFIHLIFGLLFLFICWVIITGIRLNWNFTDKHLDLYATIKRFENVYVDDWEQMVHLLGDGFSRIKFNTNFEYVEINDLTSFFKNVGIWFNGVYFLIVDFFKSIGGILSTILLYINYVIKLLIEIFKFILYPVIV